MGEVNEFVPSTWPAVDRRSDHVTRSIKDMYQRLADGDARMDNLEGAVNNNTALTQTVKDDTAEIVEAFKSLTGAMRTLETIGKVAKPLASVISLVGAVVAGWFTWKNHGS